MLPALHNDSTDGTAIRGASIEGLKSAEFLQAKVRARKKQRAADVYSSVHQG